MLLVVVQSVSTRWTKASRGAPSAAVRNATPEVLSLPQLPHSDDAAVLWHEVQFEEPLFERNERARYVRLVDVRVPGLDLLEQADGGLRVDLFGRQQFILRVGEIGLLTFNFVEDVVDDDWRRSLYRKVSANLANLREPVPDLFFARPTHRVRRLRDLA